MSEDIAAGGGGGMVDIGGMIESIGNVAIDQQNTIHEIIMDLYEHTARDPCMAEVMIRNARREYMEMPRLEATRQAALISEELRRVVNTHVERFGIPMASATGGSRFADWLINRNVIREQDYVGLGAAFGGPIGAAIAHAGFTGYVEDHLPATSSGVSQRNRGYELSPGVFVFADGARDAAEHVAQGTFTGRVFRDAFREWRQEQRRTVSPADHNQARDVLIRDVGRTREDWWIFEGGDTPTPDSFAGQMLTREEIVWPVIERATLECRQLRAREQARLDLEANARADLMGASGRADVLKAWAYPAALFAAALFLGGKLKK